VSTKLQPVRCGTPQGYRRHRKLGEDACRPCKDAINALNPKSPYPPRIAECGTRSGVNRHKRNGEPTCEACLAADAKYMREYRATHDLKPRKDRFNAMLADTWAGANQ
jgi:hypothetical protein